MSEEVKEEVKQEAAKESDAEASSAEERATRMGWTPRERFKGDQAKWVDAATFVKNGEESLPILRERLRKAESTNADLSKSVSEFKKASEDNFTKGYAKAKRELEAEIKAKAKAGDEEGAAAAAGELAELEGEKAKREAESVKDPVFDAWAGQNTWYSDPEMKLEAEAIAFKLRRRGDTTDGVPFLDKVKEQMKKQFPEKFGNPRREEGGGVERPAGGGDGGAGKAKGWEQMPSSAKEAGERYIKQKLYKDKASYATAYWAQE